METVAKYSPVSSLVEKCEPQAIEQVSTHSKITLKKSYLQIEHYNFQHGFTSCYYIKVTAELCVSLYPSASVGFAVELGNINSPQTFHTVQTPEFCGWWNHRP